MNDETSLPYKVFRKTEEGRELFVASLRDMVEAELLVARLNDSWPGDYSIRGPKED